MLNDKYQTEFQRIQSDVEKYERYPGQLKGPLGSPGDKGNKGYSGDEGYKGSKGYKGSRGIYIKD